MPSDVLSLLLAHRSIRRFKDEPIPDDAICRAVRAGQAASTSSAVQSYCLIRVRDQNKREALIELTGGQTKVARSGAFFIICGDTRRHRLLAHQAGKAYSARLEAFLLAVIDATLFAQNFVIALESMAYGICYIGGLRNQLFDVDRIINFPEGVYPLYGLCAGVPDEAPIARPRLPPGAVLFDDAYPDDVTMLAHLDTYDAQYEAYLHERGVSDAASRTWSNVMAEKFASPQRVDLGAFYESKGADLS